MLAELAARLFEDTFGPEQRSRRHALIPRGLVLGGETAREIEDPDGAVFSRPDPRTKRSDSRPCAAEREVTA